MRKQTPSLDWQIVEDDVEWECQQTLFVTEEAAPTSHRLFLKEYFWSAIALLLLLGVAGDWWWRTAQAKSERTKVQATVIAQQTSTETVSDPTFLVASIERQPTSMEPYGYERTSGINYYTGQSANPTSTLGVNLHTVEFHGVQAIANIIMVGPSGVPVYRQTRFYGRTAKGWQPAPPEPALWGSEQGFATHYLLFNYRKRDEAIVQAIAPRMDKLYTTLWRNFGLPIHPIQDRIVIDVHVTQPPGQVISWFETPNPFTVPSPALYLAPVGLSDADLLAQSIALPLTRSVIAQANARYAISKRWQPMLDALYLWQIWDTDLPLAAWQETLVKWQYVDLPIASLREAVPLPKRYQEFCAAYKLWMQSPTQVNIPLICAERHWEEWYWSPWRANMPLTRLAQFSVPVADWDELEFALARPPFPINHPGQTVALTTLIEYAVATYGYDRLPALVAGLGRYDRWETLLPAVYGISSTEFEAGWRAYLRTHYGLTVK